MSTRKQPKTPTVKGPGERFTGDVYFNAYYSGQQPSRSQLNLVRFTPGAQTAWHRHAVGQTLHVTEGFGHVQSRGGRAHRAAPRRYRAHPRREWHWHGASEDHFMCHLTLREAPADSGEPETVWGDKLTVDEYPVKT